MRVAVAAVVGYIAYFVWIAVTFSILWIAAGASFAYHPGTTRVTTGWLLVATPVSLIGAALCGWLATKIAKRDTGAKALAVVMLVVGIACGVRNMTLDHSLPPGKTPATLSAQDAAEFSIQPNWYNFAMAVATAVAAYAAGRKRGASAPAVAVAA
jgi:hypothetical protein